MVRKRFGSLATLLFPVQWGTLGIALLSNVFPFVTVLYLMLWGTASMPWVTKLLFVVLLVLCMRELTITVILNTKALFLDWLMAVFFCFALVGYVRSDYPNLTFEYFLAMNLVAFFVGRYTRVERCSSLIAYFFCFALLVTLACIVALPEIYHQWDIGGPKHPVLYDVFSTAGGLDVTLGYFPVLSGVLILLAVDMQSKVLNHILHACVAIGVVLLILIGSKSVILGSILVLLIIMAVQYKNWRRSVPLLAVLLGSSIIAVTIAPTNNLKYYGRNSIYNWIDTLKHGDDQDIMNQSDTGMVRIKIAKTAIEQIVKNPFFGIGARDWNYQSPHPHNVLLESALVFGIPSFFALVLFYILSIWLLITKQTETTESEQAKYVSVAALLLFLLLYNLVQGQLASFRSLPLFLLSGYASTMIAQRKQVTAKI